MNFYSSKYKKIPTRYNPQSYFLECIYSKPQNFQKLLYYYLKLELLNIIYCIYK